MRRLNRGLFQLAIESEEVRPEDTEARREAAAGDEVPAETPAEVPAEGEGSTGAVEVTVQVETEGKATVSEGGRAPAARAEAPSEAARTPARREAAVAEEDEVPAETPAEETPAEEVPAEEVPAEVPAETPAEAGSDAVSVQDASGRTVATVEAGEGTTTVVTEAPAEITVVEGEDGEVEVQVNVDATGGAAEEAPAIAQEELVVIEADGEAVEVEISEAVDVAEDTAELVEEVDDAEEAVVALEALHEVALLAAENGGLDSNGARLLKISTEHIYQHMGLGRAVGIPAMESFSVPGARISATSIACEEIGDKAKQIWAAIVEGIKKAAAWLAEFFQKILTANGRMKARAEKILAAAAKVNGNGKGVINNSKLASSLSVNGKLDNVAKNVAAAVDLLDKAVAKGPTVDGLKTVDERLKQADLKSDFEDTKAAVFGAIKDVVGTTGIGAVGSAGEKVGMPAAPEGCKLYGTMPFPGEQYVWAHMPESTEAIANFRTGIAVAAKDFGDKGQIRVQSPAEIKALADAAMKYVSVCEKYKEIQKVVGDLSGTVSRKLAGDVAVRAKDGVGEKLKGIIPAIKAARALMRGTHQPMSVAVARSVNAGLDLAAASLATYGAKVEAPKADAKAAA